MEELRRRMCGKGAGWESGTSPPSHHCDVLTTRMLSEPHNLEIIMEVLSCRHDYNKYRDIVG